jgi:hypothetical protein
MVKEFSLVFDSSMEMVSQSIRTKILRGSQTGVGHAYVGAKVPSSVSEAVNITCKGSKLTENVHDLSMQSSKAMATKNLWQHLRKTT